MAYTLLWDGVGKDRQIKDQARVVAHRIRQLCKNKVFQQGTKKATIGFSMGIVGCEPQQEILPQLFTRRAREALKKAKSIGEGQTAVFDYT